MGSKSKPTPAESIGSIGKLHRFWCSAHVLSATTPAPRTPVPAPAATLPPLCAAPWAAESRCSEGKELWAFGQIWGTSYRPSKYPQPMVKKRSRDWHDGVKWLLLWGYNPAINGTTLPNSLGPWSSWEKLGRKPWDSRDRIPVLRASPESVHDSGKNKRNRIQDISHYPRSQRIRIQSAKKSSDIYIYIYIYIHIQSVYTYTFSAKKNRTKQLIQNL